MGTKDRCHNPVCVWRLFCDRYDQNDLYRYAEGKKIPE